MKISDLVDTLREASKLYYTTGTSPLSDEEYDARIKILSRVDPDNPYLKEIGPLPESKKMSHIIPMGTLSKYHTDDEIKRWATYCLEDYLISPKYDGFGVELVYKRGTLVSASTRGSGYVGEDITESVKHIPNIPTFFFTDRDVLYIRGEAIIPRNNASKILAKGYVSLRNAVPGIVRSCDTELLEYVDFVAYGVYTGDPHIDSSKSTDQWRLELKEYGFFVERYSICQSFESLKSVYETIYRETLLQNSEYEYDGVVIKTNTVHPEDDLLNPTYQIAWKFQSKVQVTKLLNLSYQLGATGKFIPIAEFEPVVFQGATLTRASLGSYSRFKSLVSKGMKLGSLIEVTRNGDIIPYVKDVCPDIIEDATEIPSFTICPYCGSILEVTGSEIYCRNPLCREVLALKITAYFQGLKVKGLGRSFIDKLLSADLIRSISDLYLLSEDSLSSLKGVGETAIQKYNIFKERRVSLRELFTIYPFDNCGVAFWKKFTDEQLRSMLENPDTVTSVKGIGDERLTNVKEQIYENQEDLINLLTIMHY